MRQFEAPEKSPVPFQRGRIHQQVDVLNGVGGLEHLSNAIAMRKESSPTTRNVANGGAPSLAVSVAAGFLIDSLAPTEDSQIVMKKLTLQKGNNDYDPFYTNEQRYVSS